MTHDEHLRLSALELACEGSTHDVIGRAHAYYAFLSGQPKTEPAPPPEATGFVPRAKNASPSTPAKKAKTPVEAMFDALATFPAAPPSKPRRGASAVAKIATGKRGKK